jgi:phospholipid/cholesterol/gamma-HCH transport system substrate-binding protein
VRAVRAHLADVLAIVALVAVAAAVGAVILANQRFALPAWVPLVGQDAVEIEAELASAQSVTPGQGQTVDVAGVQVGEISAVRVERGRAIVTLRLDDPDLPVYADASVLLRPRTGLRDMVAELTPGTPAAGPLEEGRRIPIGRTLPDVALDEILAALDADTRAALGVLLGEGARGLRPARALGRTLRRLEPTARDLRRVSAALAERRRHHARAIHSVSRLAGELGGRDDQLATLVDSSNAVFASLARQEASLRAALRALPGTLGETRTALASAQALGEELGPTLQALRPAARALGPSLRRAGPFLTRTEPVVREQIRPFARATLPTARALRPAARDLAATAPDLTSSLGVLEALLNTLAYNPPGAGEEGYLFWLAWFNHLGNTLFANADAHGPIRRGVVLVSCQTLQILENVILGNPQLGVLTQLLDAPAQEEVC